MYKSIFKRRRNMPKRIFFIVLSMIIISLPSFANGLIFGVQSGISMPSADDWKAGFSLSVSGFFEITPNIAVGSIFALHRWGPDGEELLRYGGHIPSGASITLTSTSGGLNTIEIIPTVRFYFPIGDKKSLGFFALIGAGVFIQSGEGSASGSFTSTWSWGTMSTTMTYDALASVVLSGGLGLEFKIGDTMGLFICPQFGYLIQEREPNFYFSFNVGFSYKILSK